MKLILQPGAGVLPLIEAIHSAKKSVEIVVFRFDRGDVERALAKAVARGVRVHALIAHTSRAGAEQLRALEMRLLAAGVTVARTADDLERYHAKFLIVDRRELYILTFNLTYADLERSRSFGIITRERKLVEEAIRLFEADTKRQPYRPRHPDILVSPLNARQQLTAYLEGAKKELWIYDLRVSDPAMVKLLEQRAAAGLDIKLIGRLTPPKVAIPTRRMPRIRLHTRAIIRDRKQVFLGSQSMREIELDGRREVGVIVKDRAIVNTIAETFLDDWKLAEDSESSIVARKVAKVLLKELPPVAPVLRTVFKEVAGAEPPPDWDAAEVEAAVTGAVKEAVKEAVKGAVEPAV